MSLNHSEHKDMTMRTLYHLWRTILAANRPLNGLQTACDGFGTH